MKPHIFKSQAGWICYARIGIIRRAAMGSTPCQACEKWKREFDWLWLKGVPHD